MTPSSPPHSLPRRLLRWAGRLGFGTLCMLVLVLTVAYLWSSYRLQRPYEVPGSVLLNTAFRADSSLVRTGERLTLLRGCSDCHGADLGGRVMIDDPALGRVVTANLTRGGATDTFSMADWDRAVRHGISPSGRAYLVMPAQEFHLLSDADLQAIVAYIRSLPPARRTLPASQVRPLGHVLYVAGVLPLLPAERVDHDAPRPPMPAVAPTPEYGAYLAITCTGCHGADFSGGPVPGFGKVAANLTPEAKTGLGSWAEEDFARVLKTGIRPDGRALDPIMPIAITRRFTEVEVAAIWAYLRTLKPVEKADA